MVVEMKRSSDNEKSGCAERRQAVRKLVIIAGAAAGAGLLAKRWGTGCGGVDFEKMIERMPENAPPRWMFTNITAIRENTERILERLEAERRGTVES